MNTKSFPGKESLANPYAASVTTTSMITVVTTDANRKYVYLSADGGKSFSLKNGDKVQVKQSRYCTKLVRLSKKSFCEILDTKMAQEAAKYE